MKACRALLCKLPFHLLRFVQRMAGKNFAGAGRSNVRSARSACSEAMAERAEAKGAGGGSGCAFHRLLDSLLGDSTGRYTPCCGLVKGDPTPLPLN